MKIHLHNRMISKEEKKTFLRASMKSIKAFLTSQALLSDEKKLRWESKQRHDIRKVTVVWNKCENIFKCSLVIVVYDLRPTLL